MKNNRRNLITNILTLTLSVSLILNLGLLSVLSKNNIVNNAITNNIKQLNDSNSENLLKYIDNEEYTPSQLSAMISSLETRVNGLTNNSVLTEISNIINKDNSNNIFLKLYPVGSIYITNNNTNPGSIFGGTWESFGIGRTLVGVDTNDSSFNTVEKIGGNKTISYTPAGTVGNHTLTVAEIPSHRHDNNIPYDGTTCSGCGWQIMQLASKTITSSTASYMRSGVSMATGGDGAHNHPFTGAETTINVMDPYITVYMWKRTA